MEGQLNDLNEANKRLQNDNQVQKKVTTPVPIYHPVHRDKQSIDFSRMSIEDFISSGLSMVLENTVFCEDYKRWVSELERKSFLEGPIKSGNVLLIKTTSFSNSDIFLHQREIKDPAWSSDKIKCVKLLHRTDNTHIKDMTFNGTYWESCSNLEDFGTKSFLWHNFLVLAIKK
eukprot:TCONS_00040318-protein